ERAPRPREPPLASAPRQTPISRPLDLSGLSTVTAGRVPRGQPLHMNEKRAGIGGSFPASCLLTTSGSFIAFLRRDGDGYRRCEPSRVGEPCARCAGVRTRAHMRLRSWCGIPPRTVRCGPRARRRYPAWLARVSLPRRRLGGWSATLFCRESRRQLPILPQDRKSVV